MERVRRALPGRRAAVGGLRHGAGCRTRPGGGARAREPDHALAAAGRICPVRRGPTHACSSSGPSGGRGRTTAAPAPLRLPEPTPHEDVLDRPRAAARPAGSRPGGGPRRPASRGDRAAPADRGRRRADGGGRGCAGAARSPRRPRGPGGVRRPGGRHRGRDGRRRRAGARRGRRLHAPHRAAVPADRVGGPPAGRAGAGRAGHAGDGGRPGRGRSAARGDPAARRPVLPRPAGTRRPLVPLRGRRRPGGVPGRSHCAAELPRAGQAVPRVRLRDRGAQGDRRAPGGQPRPDRPRGGRPGLGRDRRRPRAAGVARRALGAAAGPARRAAREAARDPRAAHRRRALGGGDSRDRRRQPGRGPGRPAPGAGQAAQEHPARPRPGPRRILLPGVRPPVPGRRTHLGHWRCSRRVEGTR